MKIKTPIPEVCKVSAIPSLVSGWPASKYSAPEARSLRYLISPLSSEQILRVR